MRELIRRDQDRALLHGLLLDGASSPTAGSADPPASTAGAPRLGEHTDQVLTSLLDLSNAEVAALRADNVI